MKPHGGYRRIGCPGCKSKSVKCGGLESTTRSGAKAAARREIARDLESSEAARWEGFHDDDCGGLDCRACAELETRLMWRSR